MQPTNHEVRTGKSKDSSVHGAEGPGNQGCVSGDLSHLRRASADPVQRKTQCINEAAWSACRGPPKNMAVRAEDHLVHIKSKTKGTYRWEEIDPDTLGPLTTYVGAPCTFTYIVCRARTAEEEAQK